MVQNGIAKDTSEALDIIKKQNLEPKEAAPSVVVPDQTARLAKLEQVLQDFGKFFMDYKTTTEKNQTEMQNMIKQHVSEISQLKEQSMNIRREISELKRAPVVKEAPKIVAEEKEEPQEEATKAQPKPYNQRSGNFTPNDININDFFSNSHGKMMKK